MSVAGFKNISNMIYRRNFICSKKLKFQETEALPKNLVLY